LHNFLNLKIVPAEDAFPVSEEVLKAVEVVMKDM
jgi:hypothetical protein